MSKTSTILSTKVVDSEKHIALVKWESTSGFIEYSTHCIYPQGCVGLHHGRYYDSLASAEKNFKERT